MQKTFDLFTKILVFIFSIEKLILAENIYFSTWIKTDPRDVFVFETLLGQGIEDCIAACKAKKMCEYINFHTRGKTCSLIGISIGSQDVNIEEKEGYIFGRKEEWDTKKYEVCQKCESKGLCRREDHQAEEFSICQNSGCGPPENKPLNAIVLGNMFSIGNTIQYKCEESFTAMTPGTYQATCEKSGLWSSSTLKCIPATSICFGDHYYHLDREMRTWNEAVQFCESLGGYLIDIKTKEEYEFVRTALFPANDTQTNSWPENLWQDSKQIWLGANYSETEDKFKWLDGTAVSKYSQNWTDVKSDVKSDDDNAEFRCMSCKPAGGKKQKCKWHNSNCNKQFFSVCEFC